MAQMMGEPSIGSPLAERPLDEEPLVRDSFAEALSSLPAEVAHVALVMVVSEQLASFVAKPVWEQAGISSFVQGPASD